jgi:predicted XRE-type DNA-binding protein
MEYLYVCHFSNGTIKVGRSATPEARIAQHVERVACLGVTLIEKYIVPCAGSVLMAESMLIQACAENAASQSLNEWFTGLDYSTVCGWALASSQAEGEDLPEIEVGSDKINFRTLVRNLMACGVTQAQIADRCGCHQCTISDLATGKVSDPFYSMGVKLLALYSDKRAS